MGRWLDVNGEAIYGTKPTLFGAEAGSFSETEKDQQGKPKFIPAWSWRSTTGPDKIYIELFSWPSSTSSLCTSDSAVAGIAASELKPRRNFGKSSPSKLGTHCGN